MNVPPLEAPHLVARARSNPFTISVWQRGDAWKPTCTFELEVHGYRGRAVHDLKGPYSSLCAMWGDQALHVSEGLVQGEKRIVYAGAMGGDGDRTGPLYRLLVHNGGSVRLLGTVELFNASVIYRDGRIDSVHGERLFSVCFSCGAPMLSNETSLLVPVTVDFGDDTINISVALNAEERERKLAAFDKLVENYLETASFDRDDASEVRDELVRLLDIAARPAGE